MADDQAAIINIRAPERYVRVNITKQAKGYVYETTAALRWSDNELDWQTELDDLIEIADVKARMEIEDREARDAEKAAVPS